MCLLSGIYKTAVFLPFSKYLSFVSFVKDFLIASNACWCSCFHLKLPFSFTRSYITADISENRSMNLWFHPTIRKNDLRASFDSGSSAFFKAFTLSGLGVRPSWVKTYHKNSTLFIGRWHFFGDNVSPFLLKVFAVHLTIFWSCFMVFFLPRWCHLCNWLRFWCHEEGYKSFNHRNVEHSRVPLTGVSFWHFPILLTLWSVFHSLHLTSIDDMMLCMR